jgi:hypothetical protein
MAQTATTTATFLTIEQFKNLSGFAYLDIKRNPKTTKLFAVTNTNQVMRVQNATTDHAELDLTKTIRIRYDVDSVLDITDYTEGCVVNVSDSESLGRLS